MAIVRGVFVPQGVSDTALPAISLVLFSSFLELYYESVIQTEVLFTFLLIIISWYFVVLCKRNNPEFCSQLCLVCSLACSLWRDHRQIAWIEHYEIIETYLLLGPV